MQANTKDGKLRIFDIANTKLLFRKIFQISAQFFNYYLIAFPQPQIDLNANGMKHTKTADNNELSELFEFLHDFVLSLSSAS